MVLLGDEAQVEARFDPFGVVLILTQDSAQFSPNVPYARKSFSMHPMELLGDVGHVESRFNPFVDSVSVGER